MSRSPAAVVVRVGCSGTRAPAPAPPAGHAPESRKLPAFSACPRSLPPSWGSFTPDPWRPESALSRSRSRRPTRLVQVKPRGLWDRLLVAPATFGYSAPVATALGSAERERFYCLRKLSRASLEGWCCQPASPEPRSHTVLQPTLNVPAPWGLWCPHPLNQLATSLSLSPPLPATPRPILALP